MKQQPCPLRRGARISVALVAIALLGLFLLRAASPGVASPKESREKVRAEILATLKTQDDAWNRGDLDAFMEAYLKSPDMSYTAQGVVVKGYDELRARYQKNYGNNRQSMGTLRFANVEVTDLGGNYALAVGQFILERQGRPSSEGVFSLVLARTAQGWKILHDHSSGRATASAQGKPASSATPNASARQTLSGGLVIEDVTVGNGAQAAYGQNVVVHYTGWLQNGQKFDSSLDRGQPFTFQLGAGQVIPGWDRGLLGMRVGGKRRLIIPPAMGYGAQGAGGVIPPNATLYFEVELIGVK